MYEVNFRMFVKQGKCFTSDDKNSAFDIFCCQLFFSKVWMDVRKSLLKQNQTSFESTNVKPLSLSENF